MPKPTCVLDAADVSRVIEMAWEDRTPFEAISAQFELDEAAVIALMRRQLKPGSFRLWRDRVQGRKTKHAALRRLQSRATIKELPLPETADAPGPSPGPANSR